MSNRYIDAQKERKHVSFKFNDLNGLNTKGSSQSKIRIEGNLDYFTIKTLYENYDLIADNLKVYPTITIYPRNYQFDGGMGGFYHSDQNHIDLIDHYYLISMLAHEMRHAYQYIYFPDLFFKTEYSSAREYLASDIESDARGYSMDYCVAREYWDELNYLQEDEERIQMVIRNELPPEEARLNDDYFRRNPSKASIVPRTYHYEQRVVDQETTLRANNTREEKSDVLLGCATLIVIVLLVAGFILYFF